MKEPITLQQAIQYFSDEQVCIDAVAQMRWPNGVVCGLCAAENPYYLQTQKRWKCRKCRKQFSVKVNSIFEDSPIPLTKWLPALWLLVNCKNGVSSYEIARDLSVTQKSAWFMLQRLRLALQTSLLVKIGGEGSEVEADETYIGGKSRNMHKDVRALKITAAGVKDKTPVIGMLERGGKIRTMVVKGRKKPVSKLRYVSMLRLDRLSIPIP